MPALSIIMDGDSAWPDLAAKDKRGELLHVTEGLQVTALAHGTVNGATTVAIRIDLPDGRTILAETTLKLLSTAVRAFEARYPYGRREDA